MCNFGEDWATVVIDMENQILVIHDPKAWKFKEDDKVKKLNTFLPKARLEPQLLKTIGYFEKNGITNAQYTQWEITFGPSSGRNAYREKDKDDSALYCMKYVEKFIAKGTDTTHALRTKEKIKSYRFHVATTIYSNNHLPFSRCKNHLLQESCKILPSYIRNNVKSYHLM